MLRRTSVMGATVLMVLAASAALAQRPTQGQRGAGGGGGAFQASWSTLLAMPEVQKEIGVTDEQKKLVEDMLKDVRGALGANREDAKGLSKEDRKKRFEEAGKDIAEKTKKANEMAKLILEPKQLDRLEQLRLQRVGVAAFADSEVAAKLVLTQDQKDKIAKLREEARSDRGSNENLKNASKEDRKQAFDKARERGEKTQADILAFLSADQKTKWEQMQGKKFEFPQRTRGNNQ